MNTRDGLEKLRQASMQYLQAAEKNLDDSNRNIAATNQLFLQAKKIMLLEMDEKCWAADDFEIIMRIYRGMIINHLYGRHPVSGDKVAAALPLTEAAMKFYRTHLNHAGATIQFYLTGLDACLQLATDVMADRLLTGHAGTADVVLLRKAVDAAHDGLKMFSVIIPRRNDVVDVAIDQRRAIGDVFGKLCHIYRALGEIDQALLYGSEALTMFSKPGCDGSDYLAISGVYADLAEAFMFEPVSKNFFDMLSGYFFGIRETHAGEYEAVMDAYGKLPDDDWLREKILQQARDLMAAVADYSHAVTPPNTPVKLAKNSLFKAQYDSYASSPSWSDAEESLDSPRL